MTKQTIPLIVCSIITFSASYDLFRIIGRPELENESTKQLFVFLIGLILLASSVMVWL